MKLQIVDFNQPKFRWIAPIHTCTYRAAASKCSDDRLKPYNGSCYLFVSYPEVDWATAQQVCAGIHGELATVTTAEEQRFIITSLRNELDYSPQTIYWLGGRLESNKYLKWIDGSNITYKASFVIRAPHLSIYFVTYLTSTHTGLDSRSTQQRENVPGSAMLGTAVEGVAIANATVRSILDDRPLLEIRRLHLQEAQSKRRTHEHCQSNNHRHRWPSLVAK